MALSTAVGLLILSIHPDSGNEFAALLNNSTLYPRGKACHNSTTLNLLGLCLQIKRVLVFLDQSHIVPMFLMYN